MYFCTNNIKVSILMVRIIWGITGSGDRIDEILHGMIELKSHAGVRITVVTSKAGEQVFRWYKLWEHLKSSFDKVQTETNANAPFIAGPLQVGKYDLLVVAPLTGNSAAKIAHGIADTLITNAVAQANKGGTPIFVYPVDQHVGPVETKGPDGFKFNVYPRAVDLENVRRLREMEGITVLSSPSEVNEQIKKRFEII
jgi:archaeoflavoprotein AfpA